MYIIYILSYIFIIFKLGLSSKCEWSLRIYEIGCFMLSSMTGILLNLFSPN